MPMLIEHIDAIARKKGRDVLFLDFSPKEIEDPCDLFNANWDEVQIRQQVIHWLNKNQIEWCNCGSVADESLIVGGYHGRMYINVPFDTKDPVYQKLSNYLETPDGEMKLEGVSFCYLPLKIAMKNAHHDVPGFWEKWTENF